jgi:hypothetical protein
LVVKYQEVEQAANRTVVVGPNNFERNPRYRGEETPAMTNAVVFRDCADCAGCGQPPRFASFFVLASVYRLRCFS